MRTEFTLNLAFTAVKSQVISVAVDEPSCYKTIVRLNSYIKRQLLDSHICPTDVMPLSPRTGNRLFL